MKLAGWLTIAAAVSVAGCAAGGGESAPAASLAPSDAPAGQCVYVADVTGFTSQRAGVIYAATARGETVRIETLGSCTAAQGAQSLALHAPGAARVCSAVGLEVLAGGRRCPVSRFQVLSPAEVEALPADDRP